MRLPLAASAAAWTFVACVHGTSHEVSLRVHRFEDERLTVTSPALRASVESGVSRLSAGYGLDIVSGATQALDVDAVSAATNFSERRHQVDAAVEHALRPETELSAGYTSSFEPDHSVHAPSFGVSHEFMQRMVRASLRYQLALERIGRVDDPAFSESALGQRLDLGWTQIVARSLLLTALATATAYDCGERLGCFASPYRYVRVTELRGGALALPERHPGERFTGAAALRLSWAVSRGRALHFGYRLSRDSWGITAHTADTAAAAELFSGKLLVRGELRSTVQSGASFYDDSYAGSEARVPAFRTADAELSHLWNVRLLSHVEWAWGPARLVGELGRMWNYYPDFSALPARHAWLGSLGVDAEF